VLARRLSLEVQCVQRRGGRRPGTVWFWSQCAGRAAAQGANLMQMIGAAVGTLVPILQGLGRRHGGYGVMPAHYATVGAALLKTLGEGLSDAFTPAVKQAWTEVYGVIASTMIEAAATAEPVAA
jgi:hemoglobin-like flavoprotein